MIKRRTKVGQIVQRHYVCFRWEEPKANIKAKLGVEIGTVRGTEGTV